MFWTLRNSGLVFGPEGVGSDATPAADAAPAVDAAVTMYPDDPATPAAGSEKPQVTEEKPLVEGEKPLVGSEDDGGTVAADDLDADARKAARQAELEKMSPEDRAKAEAEDATAEAEEARLSTVPEDGVYDLKMPEGVEVDKEMMAALGPAFKDLWLTNGQAQALADRFIEVQQQRNQKASETWAETQAGWVDTAKSDKQMGGDKWDATVSAATRAIDQFGTPQLKEYLNATGGGNHPELIRLMAKVGAALGEDNPAISEAPGKPITADKAAVMYPDDQPKGR